MIEGADEVLRRAREDADSVLFEARQKADLRVEESNPPLAPSVAVARERVLEDALIQDERAAADTTLQLERAQAARVLAQLLPFEREQTDLFLNGERVRSDDALASRDDFLGLVSHDLRNLLGGIVLSAAVVEKAIGNTPEDGRILVETTRIQRLAARMNRLIGDLLDVASIEAGRLSVDPRRGDLATLLAEVVDAFKGAATAKGLTIALVPAGEPLRADFDHARLFQVLGNLIMNAIKFSSPGGSIAVHGERTEESWRCSVTDTGFGIPADQLEIVFDRVLAGRQEPIGTWTRAVYLEVHRRSARRTDLGREHPRCGQLRELQLAASSGLRAPESTLQCAREARDPSSQRRSHGCRCRRRGRSGGREAASTLLRSAHP